MTNHILAFFVAALVAAGGPWHSRGRRRAHAVRVHEAGGAGSAAAAWGLPAGLA
jgi:hypothetical protein